MQRATSCVKQTRAQSLPKRREKGCVCTRVLHVLTYVDGGGRVCVVAVVHLSYTFPPMCGYACFKDIGSPRGIMVR